MLIQLMGFKHPGAVQSTRVELVVLRRAAPGIKDDIGHRQRRCVFGSAQYAIHMLDVNL
ncbi:hypothetical protein D3C73_1620060 [compost metagenome]